MHINTGLALALTLGLGLMGVTACGSSSNTSGLSNANTQAQGANSINPTDRSKLKAGGEFRWAVDNLPTNWNYNEVDGTDINGTYQFNAMMPRLFLENKDATVSTNPDYLTSATLVSTSPQIVEYKINPKATWTLANGSTRPVSWEDFQAQWKALNGTNSAYQVASSTGYSQISDVAKGTDDFDVKATFSSAFSEWKSLFSFLYPKEVNSSAATFNTGELNGLAITAGPFKVGNINTTSQTSTLVPDANWWGTKPILSKLTFISLTRSSLADSFANNSIDYFDLGSLTDQYAKVKSNSAAKINSSPNGDWSHLDFSGKSTSATSDPAVRLALMQAIDRTAVTKATLGQMVANPVNLDNHIYPQGTQYYKDNSNGLTPDATKAGTALDAAGWKLNGTYRSKNGKELDLNMVIPAANTVSANVALQMQTMLKAAGAKVSINSVPTADFFSKYIIPGAFDMTFFRWIDSAYPISGSSAIYMTGGGQNYGGIADSTVDSLFKQGNSEFDDTKRAALGNEIDAQLWKVGFSLPLYALPGASATRSTVGNFGAWGYQDINYTDIGFIS